MPLPLSAAPACSCLDAGRLSHRYEEEGAPALPLAGCQCQSCRLVPFLTFPRLLRAPKIVDNGSMNRLILCCLFFFLSLFIVPFVLFLRIFFRFLLLSLFIPFISIDSSAHSFSAVSFLPLLINTIFFVTISIF